MLIVGWSRPCFIWRSPAMVSTMGEAQQVCPSMDLAALNFIRYACAPKACFIALISSRSPPGVPVA